MADPINPNAQWPGDNMDPDQIEKSAGQISTVGTNVSTTGGDVAKAWAGLKNGYQAPEQETLFGAMQPATKAASDFATDMGKVSTALTTFAGQVRTIKANVAKIRAEAESFVAGIHNGKVTITQHVVENRAQLEMGESTTTSQQVDWQSDDATVQQNNSLIRRVNDQQEQLWAAERTCANAIRDIYGAPHIFAASQSNPNGYGVDQIPDNASNLPWGNTVDVKESCGDKVADGVFVDGLVNGLGGLIGFHYTQESATTPESAGFSWSTLGHTWEGVGQLATGITTGPLTPFLAGLPGPVGKWFNASTETYAGFVPSLLGINVFNHDPNKMWYQDLSNDPFANWKNDPARTAGSVGFNVLTFAIPGPKGMGAFTKAGDAASAVDKAGEVSDAARATDGLGDLSKVAGDGGDLAKTAEPATTTALGDLGKTTSDLGDGLDNLGKTDIEVPNAPHDSVTVDHPSVGDHVGDHGDASAPEPRDPGHAGTGDAPGTTGHEPSTAGHEPGTAGHDPSTMGHEPSTTGHEPSTGQQPHDPSNPAAHDHSGYDKNGVWHYKDKGDPTWSNHEKGAYGEKATDAYMQAHKFERVDNPHASVSKNGIDSIYKDPATGKYAIVESKWGHNSLSMTKDGRQMSDTWLRGRIGPGTRIQNAVAGNPRLAAEITRGLRDGNTERFVANVHADGTLHLSALDSLGKKLGAVDVR